MKKLSELFFQSAFILVPALVSLALSLWYQLRVFDTHIVFIFDSAHYFLASSQLLSVLQACLAGNMAAAQGLITENSFVANLMLDGPVLPMLGALAFLATKHPALASSWPVIVVLLSFVNAVSTGATAFIANSLTGSKKFSAAAACLFAACPTTITSSGRFLTEPVATFLLLVLAVSCSAMVTSRRSNGSLVFVSLLAGAACALGFLLKPALLPAWTILIALALFFRYRAKASLLVPLLAASATIILIMGSWLAFTKVATGKFYLMPQRQPASNVAQGHELETDGRGAMGFDSPTDKVHDAADSRDIFVKAWVEHPQQVFNLYLRKMARTLGFAWNDFKQRVFGLDIEQQDFLHAVLVALASIGFVLMVLELAAGPLSYSSRQYFVLVLPALIIIHATLYIPFESTVRYGAPALPFLVISALLACQWLHSLGWKTLSLTMALILLMVLALKIGPNIDLLQWLPLGQALLLLTVFKISLLLILATSVLWLLVQGAALRSLSMVRRRLAVCFFAFVFVSFVLLPVGATSLFKDNQRECRIDLSSGDELIRDLILPAELARAADSHYLIYIDCDSRFASSQFTFNGVPLKGKLISANKMDSACYFVFNIMRMYASVFDLPVEQMRQWRVLEVPVNLMRFGGSNRLRVIAGPGGLTVFADRFDFAEQAIRLPNRALFSASKMCNEGLELDGRVLERSATKLWSAGVSMTSSDSQLKSLLYRQPRLYLLQAKTANAVGSLAHFATPLALARFDPVLLASGEGQALKIDRYTMQLAKTTSTSIPLPEQFRSVRSLQISLKGMVRSIGRNKKVGIFVTLHGAEPSSPFMILPGSPPFIAASSQFSEFEVTDRIYLSAAPNSNYFISVGFFPGRWEQVSQYGIDRSVGSFLIKDLVLSISNGDDIDLRGGAIRY